MGNDQCQQCKQHEFEECPAYGAYEIYQQGTKIYAIIQKKVQKDPILQAKVIQQLEQRKTIEHPHVVNLHKYSIEETDYGFRVVMFYEFIPRTLRNRMEELRERGQNFSERELFAIIYGIESALNQLVGYNIKHCCVNLDTILCKNNFYKLTDVSSTTYLTSYDLVSRNDREQFLSEKLLNSKMNKSLEPDYTLRDDLFSLGMICLMLAANKRPQDLYSWDSHGNGTINTHAINFSIRHLENNYSSKLSKKIKSLIFDPQTEQLTKQSFTNLSDSLQELQQQMSRVLGKAKNLNSTDVSLKKHIKKLY